jgi:hypothetical protein
MVTRQKGKDINEKVTLYAPFYGENKYRILILRN